MGHKRKRKFENQTNAELFSNIRWNLDGFPWIIGRFYEDIHYMKKGEWSVKDVIKHVDSAVSYVEKAVAETRKMLEVLEQRVATQGIEVEPIPLKKGNKKALHKEEWE